MITDNILAVVLTTALLWYDNSSDSANFKEIFDGCEQTTEYCVVPEHFRLQPEVGH